MIGSAEEALGALAQRDAHLASNGQNTQSLKDGARKADGDHPEAGVEQMDYATTSTTSPMASGSSSAMQSTPTASLHRRQSSSS